MPENTTGCVVHSKPAEARHGLLCTVHFDRLADMLRSVEEEAALLSAVPSMAQRQGSGRGSLASERTPVRIDVLAFRDPQTRQWTRDETARHPLPAPKSFGPWCLFCDHETCTAWRAGRRRDLHDDEHDAGSDRLMSILGVLNGWARVVREERGLTEPDRITVTGERATLTRHLEWIAAQPFIDETYAEVRRLVASLKDLNGTQDEKPVGKCYLPSDTGICEGPIWVDDAAGHAHCGRCRETWDGAQVLKLKRQLEIDEIERARPKTSDGRRMFTVKELAEERQTTVNAIRLRLSKAGARAVRGHYDPAMLDERSKSCA